MRFIAAGNRQAVVNLHQETYINMLVLGPVLTGRYGMNINIKNSTVKKMYMRWIETTFLGGFAQSDAKNVGIAISMAARLKPLIMLAMVHHEYTLTIRADNPG